MEDIKLQNQEVQRVEYISFDGVELIRAVNDMTAPKLEAFTDYIEDDFSVEMQKTIATAWSLNEPILLEGGTSLGKTRTVLKMCADLGYEAHKTVLDKNTDRVDLIGQPTVNPNFGNEDQRKYIIVLSELVKAITPEEGKIKVIILDEYNFAMPGVTAKLHDILDAYKFNSVTLEFPELGGVEIKIDPSKVKFVGLMNPPGGGYLDRNPVDPANLRRWVYQKLPNELPKETLRNSIDAIFGIGDKKQMKDKKDVVSRRDKVPESEFINIPGIKEILPLFIAFHESAKQLVSKKEIGKDQVQKFNFDDREEPRRVKEYISRFYKGDITETIQEALRYIYAGKLLPKDRVKLEEIIRKISFEPEQNENRNALPESKSSKQEAEKSEQDLDGLTFVEIFTLETSPINPKSTLEEKSPTDTIAGIYSGSNFDSRIRPLIQDINIEAAAVPISSFTLDRNMTGEELKDKLKTKPFTVEEFATFINNQTELEGNIPKIKSPLDTTGNYNLFLIEQADGSVSVVYALWDFGHRKWRVVADGLSGGWRADFSGLFSQHLILEFDMLT